MKIVLIFNSPVNGGNGVIEPSLISNIYGLQYFKNLQFLRMWGLNVSDFSFWPAKLKYIYMANMILDSIANFPDSLIKFQCYPSSGFNMQSLPSLPPTLQVLTIPNASNLTTLPLLPPSLKHLEITVSRFSSLPPLTIGLEYLELQYLLFNFIFITNRVEIPGVGWHI